MAIHNIHYQHWDGQYQNIWRRRWVIVSHGVHSCLANKWMVRLMTSCWGIGFSLISTLFLIGQLLVPDSIITEWLGHLNPMLQTVGKGLVNWLVAHPEISVKTEENLLFFLFCKPLFFLSIFAVFMTLPHLITRDISSRAIIIYSSKAITRWDYLLGKFGVVFGVLCLTWVFPLFIGWLVGNLLAPNWGFFWHSRAALLNSLSYSLFASVVLSVIALGASAVSRREKDAIGLWILLWVAGNVLADFPNHAHQWLKYCSFQRCIEQISFSIFHLANDMDMARQNIPMFREATHEIRQNTITAWQNPDLQGSLIALGIMMALSLILIVWRVRPE